MLGPAPAREETGGVATHVAMLHQAIEHLGHEVVLVPWQPIRLLRAPLMTLPALILARYSFYVSQRCTSVLGSILLFFESLVRSRFRPDVINIQNVLHVPLAMTLKRLTGAPVVLTVHGYLTPEAEASGLCRNGDPLWQWYHKIETDNYRLVDRIVAVSDHVVTYLDSYRHAPITVIRHGVDTTMFEPGKRHDHSKTDHGYVILFAATLEPHKGLSDAIRALALLIGQEVSCHMIVAGDGPDRAPCRELARQLGVDEHVTWRGQVSKRDMPNFYLSGSVLVVPSRRRAIAVAQEPFGYTALEAMSSGLPVVAYEVGGLKEQILDEVTGYLVPEGDIQGLAAKLKLLQDPQTRGRMGEAARAHAVKTYSADIMARSYLQVYKEARENITRKHK